MDLHVPRGLLLALGEVHAPGLVLLARLLEHDVGRHGTGAGGVEKRQHAIAPCGYRLAREILIQACYACVSMALKLLLVWLINALALLALPYIVPSVQVDSFYTALIAALLLGFVNTLIRPLIVLLTLPATVLTLGLFIFVINGLLFWFVASFVKGFSVAGFWSAFFGAIVYALDRKSTRLNSSHQIISYAVFCLKKKK